MFALLEWIGRNEFYSQANWDAEARVGVPFKKIDRPTDKQEARYISTERKYMTNEWGSAHAVTGISDWKSFMAAPIPSPVV